MQKVVVLGGGESGVGSAVLAKVKGFDVFLSDSGKIKDDAKATLAKWEIEYEEGGHTMEKILNANEVVKSPGIPDNVPLIVAIKEKGIGIISEIEFAGRYDSAKKICITGSNGKTTTTSLIYFMLKNAGLNVGLAGNIGQSYAYQVATCSYDYYVLELSSFQLDGMYSFKADIAILMNITPDHLDRYDFKMQNYVNSKFRITQNMKEEDCFIFCEDDPVTIGQLEKIVSRAKMLPFTQKNNAAKEDGAWVEDDRMCVGMNGDVDYIYLKELALQGKHNVYNSMAAAIAAKAIKIDKKVIRESLMTFKGVEHRMEKVLKIKNRVINNSVFKEGVHGLHLHKLAPISRAADIYFDVKCIIIKRRKIKILFLSCSASVRKNYLGIYFAKTVHLSDNIKKNVDKLIFVTFFSSIFSESHVADELFFFGEFSDILRAFPYIKFLFFSKLTWNPFGALTETEKATLNSSSLLGSLISGFLGLLPVIQTPAIPVLSPESDISRCINKGLDRSAGFILETSKKFAYCRASSGPLPTSIMSLVNGFLYVSFLIWLRRTPEIYLVELEVEIPALSVKARSILSSKASL